MPVRGRAATLAKVSRVEALNAVEFFNRPISRLPLRTFLVHMHLAWRYLLYAEFQAAGIPFYLRDPERPARFVREQGRRVPWDLDRCLAERWPDEADPVRQNLDFTIQLRERIEPRYEPGLMVIATGFVQALIVNYDEELTGQFGQALSIAPEVQLPISLSTFSRDGLASLISAQQALPASLRDWIVGVRADVDQDTQDDRRFEFRLEIVQKRSPVHDGDLAVSFVREEELSDEDRTAYQALERSGRIVLREQDRPVSGLGLYKPKALAAIVETAIPFRFGASYELAKAWRHFKVRPPSSARGAARRRTDGRYCVYDEPHDDYMYTHAFAELLIRKCATAPGFLEVVGRPPHEKAPDEAGAVREEP